VVVDLGRGADHSDVDEDRERGGFQVALGQCAGLEVFPQHGQHPCSDDGVDVDRVGGFADQAGLAVLAHAAAKHRLDEDLAMALDQLLDLALGRIGAEHLGGRKLRSVAYRKTFQ
jgi:hypothetical protein